jgi:hypothetical protein
MEVGIGISEFLCKAKIDDTDAVAMHSLAQKKVVRFDVAVNEVMSMYGLDPHDLTEPMQWVTLR